MKIREVLFLALVALAVPLSYGAAHFSSLVPVEPAPYPIAVAREPALQDTVVKLSQGAGHGSGVVINAEKGLILTAHHVAEHATDGPMTLTTTDGCVEPITVRWLATDHDVALIQATEHKCALHAATIRTTPVALGEPVTAIGYPLWLGEVTTTGHVIAVDATTPTDTIERLLVTDALLAPGNSGGGLFDRDGHLIAITVGVVIMPPGIPSGHELNIPMSTVCALLVC